MATLTKSFILTIWNVNPSTNRYLESFELGFILTIWNVNTATTYEDVEKAIEFYLNYMECKWK